MITKLKKGNNIYIKPKNRGKFREYCNGKVTDECIRRGKNSSDPKIRKRATFADNARHFKHKSGGKAFVKSPNVLDSNPNIYKYNKKTKGIKKHALGGITDDLIDSVIKEEGFNSTPTNIGDGKITLGSGLTDSVWHEIYKKKGKWTEEDNRNAVKKELEKRLKWALDTVPNWNKLNDNQQKAFLSYNYNYNVTPKNSPKFFYYMKLGLFDLAGKEMNATSDDPKFKQGLLERRLREQVLWNTPISQPKIYIKEPKLTEQSDNTKVFNTQYPSTHRIIPTKKGNYIVTDEGQIFKNIMNNRMKVKLIMTPKKPEPYKFPILFLSGGIIKAANGTNIFGKVLNFMSSDLGKGIMNIGTQLFSNIKNSRKTSDYINQDNQRIRTGKEAILSNIDVADEARNQLNLLQVLNPDIHYGEIDLQLMLLKLYQQARKKKMNEANAWEQELIDKQKELVDAIQGNGTMDFSGLISNGVSALSKYLGNPKVTSSSSRTTSQLNYDFGIKLNTPNIQKPYWMK